MLRNRRAGSTEDAGSPVSGMVDRPCEPFDQELTLDEILQEPIVRLLIERDRLLPADVRGLALAVGHRLAVQAEPARSVA